MHRIKTNIVVAKEIPQRNHIDILPELNQQRVAHKKLAWISLKAITIFQCGAYYFTKYYKKKIHLKPNAIDYHTFS